MQSYPVITLSAGREKSVLRHHPWIFSKALAQTPDLPSGSQVCVRSADGQFLGYGIYSAKSQIKVRLLSFKENAPIDDALIASRVIHACKARDSLRAQGNDGVRLIAAEGDFLPGVIVDLYNNFLVIAISSWAGEAIYDSLIATLKKIFPTHAIYERSDGKARQKEGLKPRTGVIAGNTPEDIIYVKENDLIYLPIDIKNGHKTGGYLDQRDSRAALLPLAKGTRVLNCFAYTGGFGLYALKGRARRVENIDVSALALKHAKEGTAFNHLDPGHARFIQEDVFAYLRAQVAAKEKYDVVVLDPPKFAESAANLKKACRGYQDINRLGFELLREGGQLLTFSCSGLMDNALFQKICADAALEAGVDAQVVRTFRQAADHRVALPCPESFYLKGLQIQVCSGGYHADH